MRTHVASLMALIIVTSMEDAKFSQSIQDASQTIKDKYLNFLSEIIKLHQDTKG